MHVECQLPHPFRNSNSCNYFSLYNYLINAPANPLVRNDDGQTPLDVARIEGFVDVVRLVEVWPTKFSNFALHLS